MKIWAISSDIDIHCLSIQKEPITHYIRQIKQLETCYCARFLISCAICRISVGSGLNRMCTQIRLRALLRKYLTINNNATMNRPNHPSTSNTKALHSQKFIIGELYLFHPKIKHCPAHDSLWGIFNSIDSGKINLESYSLDLQNFSKWHYLPSKYKYSRRATRAELRDYMYNLGQIENKDNHK